MTTQRTGGDKPDAWLGDIPIYKSRNIVNASTLWTEAEFQETVIEMARALGWRVHAERPASSKGKWSTPIQGDPGYPDLCLVRDGHLVYIECKSQRGILSQAQGDWLADLAQIPGVTALMLRPSDMERIKELLQ